MALSEDQHPASLFRRGLPEEHSLHQQACSWGKLTHVSAVLAESGIPVADTLKERMLEELVRLAREEEQTVHEGESRRSA